jgi:hypothetical protein
MTPTRQQIAAAGLVHWSGYLTPDQAAITSNAAKINAEYAASLPKRPQGRPKKDAAND